MAKLILSNGETIVDQCWLDDTRVTIGRAKGNRIAVNDPAANAGWVTTIAATSAASAARTVATRTLVV